MILEADDLSHGIGVAEELARRRLGEEDAERLVESSGGVARCQGQGEDLQNLRVAEEKGILVEALLPVADKRHRVVHVQHAPHRFYFGRFALKAGAEDGRRRQAGSLLTPGDDSVDALAVLVKTVGLQLAENPDGHEHAPREPNRQAADVGQRVEPVAGQMARRDVQVALEHDLLPPRAEPGELVSPGGRPTRISTHPPDWSAPPARSGR